MPDLDELELTPDETARVTAAAQAAADREVRIIAAERDLLPHARRQPRELEKLHDRLKGEADGKWRAAAYRDLATACPDCTRGLYALDRETLACVTLEPLGARLHGVAGKGGLIACGRDRDGLPVA